MDKNIMIADSSEQNVVIDKNGVLCREYLPYEEEYDKRQLKILSRGLYITDDDWENVRAGIGDFTYYDPATGETKQGYGVIANVLIAPLILSEDVGVYNEDGTVKLDKNGLTITHTGTGEDDTVFRVQKQTDGDSQTVDVIYFDSEGNAHFNGKISASALYGGILTLGGANNVNGTLKIVDANGAVIGTWDKDGITINKGSVTANAIKGGTLTLGGSGNVNGQIALLDANGAQIGTWDNTKLKLGEAWNFVQLYGPAEYNGVTEVTPFYAVQTYNGGSPFEMMLKEAMLVLLRGSSGLQLNPDSIAITEDKGNGYEADLEIAANYLAALMGGTFTIQVDNGVLDFVVNGLSINGTAGASGSFTTADGKTVTVTNGLITSIV